jgi:hypothetical protein
MKFIRRIKALIRKYKAKRKLEKSGYKSWAVYRRMRDPDVVYCASRVKDFYQGYKFVHCIENRNHYAYELLYDYGPGGIRYGNDDMYDWLDQKARFKSRMDMHRVIKYPSTGNEWTFNDMGGGDYIFVAFKDEKDYMLFLLRWS